MTSVSSVAPITALIKENDVVVVECLVQFVRIATISDVTVGEAICANSPCSLGYIVKASTPTRRIPLADARVPWQRRLKGDAKIDEYPGNDNVVVNSDQR